MRASRTLAAHASTRSSPPRAWSSSAPRRGLRGSRSSPRDGARLGGLRPPTSCARPRCPLLRKRAPARSRPTVPRWTNGSRDWAPALSQCPMTRPTPAIHGYRVRRAACLNLALRLAFSPLIRRFLILHTREVAGSKPAAPTGQSRLRPDPHSGASARWCPIASLTRPLRRAQHVRALEESVGGDTDASATRPFPAPATPLTPALGARLLQRAPHCVRRSPGRSTSPLTQQA